LREDYDHLSGWTVRLNKKCGIQEENYRTQMDEHQKLVVLRDEALLKAKQQAENLDLMRAEFNQFQVEKLSTVDHFEPDVDEEMVSKFQQVGEVLKTFALFLARDSTTLLSEREWHTKIMESPYMGYNSQSGAMNVQQKRSRRMLWTCFLWGFFDLALLESPFAVFGGHHARHLDSLWQGSFQARGLNVNLVNNE
jgi:hypothetical protein